MTDQPIDPSADSIASEAAAFLDHLGVVEQLRREVAGGADDEARRGDPRVVGGLRDPEVDEHRAGVGDEHVGGLEVAMHDAGLVDRGQRAVQPGRELVQLAGVERSVPAHDVLEVVPGDELGHEERLGRVGLRVQHRRDAGVVQPLQRQHLATQPVPGDRVGTDVRVQQLERDRRPAAVQRAVHGPHAPRAEGRDDRVAADL